MEPSWRKRFFDTTRGRVLALLRRGDLTVDDLARSLGLTDNAVRAQLATLERDGLVIQRGVRRGAGKPSYAYGLAPDFEPALSRAYPPLVVHLLEALHERLPDGDIAALLTRAGELWSAGVGPAGGSLRAKAEQAAALLAQLGGDADVEESGEGIRLRAYGCPLGVAVCREPRVCTAVEALLSKATGTDVRECCDRSGPAPSCRFVLGGSR